MIIIVVLIIALLIYRLQGHIYKKNWSKGLSLSIKYERSTAFEGDSLSLIEVLTNNKWLPLPWVSVKFNVSRNLNFKDINSTQVTDYYYRNDLFSITTRQRITRRLPFVCSKRGYYPVKSADLVSSNLLGTSLFARKEHPSTALTVYPKLADLGDWSIPFGHIGGDISSDSILNPDPFEFRGIREYLPTDSLKFINFKASAKTGTLMSNEYNETVSQEIVIFLNTEKYREWLHDDLNEYAISLAAAAAAMAIETGIPVSLYTNALDVVTKEEQSCPPGSGEGTLYTMLDLLARIDLEQQPAIKGRDLLLDHISSDGSNTVYIVVSPYFLEDFRETFDSCLSSMGNLYWLLPHYKDEQDAAQLSSENIITYEVEQ